VTSTIPDSIASLAARLTDPKDRETYAELMCYVSALPPGDEFRRLAELMGLLSLLGQRLPEALAESLTALRLLAESAGDHYNRVEKRLSGLPQEITKGVDPSAMAKVMSEAFRQQLAATALQETAALLKSSTGEIKSLSGQITSAIKPASAELGAVAASISRELSNLRVASAELRQWNAELAFEEQRNSWLWQSMCAFVLFLVGCLVGVFLERRQTTDAIAIVGSQMERIQSAACSTPADLPNKTKRSRGH
jgi:hypothetical protein